MYILMYYIHVCTDTHTNFIIHFNTFNTNFIIHYFPLIATRPHHHCRLLNMEPCRKHKEEMDRMKR